jgi:large subunit ribosomal protein L17
MRHRKKFNHLGRKSAHRKAMLSNMASSLILHKRIRTTVAKAKALRMYVEPLITKSKDDSTHSRRVVFSYLKDKHAVTELFREVSVKIASRPGGYTRILKTGNRLGDNADMCIIELVDYNENMLAKKEEAKEKTTRRSRRGKKKADTTTATTEKKLETKKDTVETVEEKVEDKVEEVKAESKKAEKKEEKSEEKPKTEDKDEK